MDSVPADRLRSARHRCAGSNRAVPISQVSQYLPAAEAGSSVARQFSGNCPQRGEITMAKGQMRSNKEAKKPKKDKVEATKAVTGLGSGSSGNTAKK
jgi:hypothetical protein